MHPPGSAAGDAYVAAKHGIVGLMRNLANAHAKDNIRVNAIHPTGVRTMMVENEALARLLDVDLVECDGITNAVLWLVSDAARYVTGVSLPVDAGSSAKM